MNQNGLPLFLAVLTCLGFVVQYAIRRKLEESLLFILYGLPFMGLLATKTSWGGFKVFDVLSLGCLFMYPAMFTRSLLSLSKGAFTIFLAFVVVLLLGSLASEFPAASILALVQVIPAFVYCRFVLLACTENSAFFARILRALQVSSVVLLVFIAAQLVSGLAFSFYPVLNQNTFDPINNTIRYPGFFHDSQANGQFLAMAGFLFLYSGRGQAGTSRRFLYGGMFLACCAGVLLSGSRSALAGLAVGLLLLLLGGGWRLLVAAVAGGLIIVSLYTLANPSVNVLNRTANIDEDYKFRQSVWLEAVDIALNHPGLGIGIGNFQSYTAIHKQELYLEIDDEIVYFDQPENGYLKVLSEIGFIGFILFLYFVLSPVVKSVFYYLKGYYDYKILFLIAAVASWLMAFNTVYSLFDSRITLIVVTLLALLLVHPNNLISLDESTA